MSHHGPRVTWKAAKAAVKSLARAPIQTAAPLRFRPPPATWFGRCLAFRPSYHPDNEKRGRLAHAAD